VTVTLEGFAPMTRAVRVGDAVLDVGVLGSETGFTIRGRVEDPTGLLAGSAFVFLAARTASGDGRQFQGTLDPKGRFELRGLPGEPLILTIDIEPADEGDPRRAKAEVRVDPRTQTDLGVVTLVAGEGSVPKRNALRVTVTDANGALARAGFRDGDVIVGVGGEPFQDEQHALSMLVRLAQGAVDCDVQRESSRLVVRLESTAVAPGQAGGRLDACVR
jgi:hypothetical protein